MVVMMLRQLKQYVFRCFVPCTASVRLWWIAKYLQHAIIGYVPQNHFFRVFFQSSKPIMGFQTTPLSALLEQYFAKKGL